MTGKSKMLPENPQGTGTDALAGDGRGSGAARRAIFAAAKLACGASRLRILLGLVALVAVLLAGVAPGRADVAIDAGTVINVPGDQEPPWNISGTLYVGRSSEGTLNILDGGFVSNTDSGIIGLYAGSQGMVKVSGPGSEWTNSGSIYGASLIVGNSGAGMLHILDGGFVSNDYGYVGYNAGSEGRVTVSGLGSKWTNSKDLCVGCGSITGILNIWDGGEVSSASGYIGYEPATRTPRSLGTVTVSGSGSNRKSGG
jgi:T5SS/PEP-CTERM-associated repeat protein